MSRGTGCKLPLACGVQLELFVGVTAADVAADEQLDFGDGVAWFVVWDGAQVAACVRRAAGACRRSDGRGCRGGRAAGLGGWSGAGCRVGRCASFRSRGARSWCLSSEGRPRTLRRTRSWPRWWGWCGLSCGTACMLPLAWGVQFVLLFSAWRWQGWCGMSRGTECKLPLACGVQLELFVGVTSADVAADAELAAVVGVVRLTVWDGVHVAACVCRAAGAYRWSDGRGRRGGRGAGRSGGGGAAYVVGRRARCCLRGACGLFFLSACRWRGW